MAQDRKTLRAPAASQRRPAVPTIQRSAVVAPSPAQVLQHRLGNQGAQALIARSIAAREGKPAIDPPSEVNVTTPPSIQLSRATRLPAKVSKPNDSSELEAEEMARKVMRMRESPATTPVAQSGVAKGAVQRSEALSPSPSPPSSPASAHISGGAPLPSPVRSHMEPRFGASFANVRVHSGEAAARQSEALNANAFTVGENIFFGRDKFQPQSASGQELIAHELTHTIQQGAAVQRSVDTAVTQIDQPQVHRKAAKADRQQAVSSDVVDVSTGVFNPSARVKGEIEAQGDKGLMVRVVAKGLAGEGQVKTTVDRKGQYDSSGFGSMPLLNPWTQQLGGMYLNFTVKNNAVAGYASFKSGGGDRNDWLETMKRNSSLLGGVGLKVQRLPTPVNKFETGKLTLGVTNLDVEVGGFLDAKFNILLENADKPKIQATAKIKITGIDEGTLSLDNTQEKLTGQVSLAINLKSFSGSAVVKYLADGTVDVSGKGAYNANKLSGQIQFVVTDLETANKFAKDAIAAAGGKENVQDAPPPAPVPLPKPGKKTRAIAATGQLSFNLTQWFAGTVNVVVDAKGAVTVIGKIAPPGEILLFPQKSWDKELIKFEAKAYYGIPVVGNLNLFANISLHALADLGPAKIYKIEVLGTYSTDPEIQKNIQISGSINISAYAGLRLRAEGGAGIELAGHDLKFGIGLNADVGVKAYAEARPTFGYRDPGQFYISGTLEMIAQPMLGLGGEFFIELDTPWWSPLSDDKWTWPLFSKEWPLSDPIGINASVKEYVLGSGKVPEIELKKPEFDPSKFMTSMVDRNLPDKSGGKGAGQGTFKDDGSVPKPTVPPKKPAPPKPAAKPGKKGPAPAGGKSAKPDPKAQSDQVATKALKDGLDALKKNEPYSKPELTKALGALKAKVKGTSFNTKPQGDKWIVTPGGGGKKKSTGQITLGAKKDKSDDRAKKDKSDDLTVKDKSDDRTVKDKSHERTKEEKKSDLAKGIAEAQKLLEDKKLTAEQVRKELPRIKTKYTITILGLVVYTKSSTKETVFVHGEIHSDPVKADSDKIEKAHEFEIVNVTAPSSGKSIRCAKKGSVLVPIDKVEIYPMGKVAMYPKEELRQLQAFKQNDRKRFDADPKNEERLAFIRDRLKKNYERSQEMFESIKSIGLSDSVADIIKIISHLLSVGEGVSVETRVEHKSQLEGPLGPLTVRSTWAILPDGTRYLSTIILSPKGG